MIEHDWEKQCNNCKQAYSISIKERELPNLGICPRCGSDNNWFINWKCIRCAAINTSDSDCMCGTCIYK